MPKTIYKPKQGEGTKTAPAPATKVATRTPSRAAGPLILVLCLVLAVVIVLFVPTLAGGAATSPSTSGVVSSAPEAQNFNSVQDAVAQLNFTPVLPVVENASLTACRVLDGQVLELTYSIGGTSVVYRTGEGSEDLSGDYAEYAYMANETVDGVARGFAGNTEDSLCRVVWAHGGYSYSLCAQGGIEADALREMAESIVR